MENTAERRIPIYKLLDYKTILKQTFSFSENIDRCNFTTQTGWRGKLYVNEHGVNEYKPVLRGIDALDVNYIKFTDYVTLTELQYKDYRIVSGLE